MCEIDSRKHVRIDGTFAVQKEFEISHCGYQFRLRKPFDEIMKLVFVRHLLRAISLRYFVLLAALVRRASLLYRNPAFYFFLPAGDRS